MTDLLERPILALPEPPPHGYFTELRVLGGLHIDAMKTRIAAGNRIGSADVEQTFKDTVLIPVHAALKAAEDGAERALIKQFKRDAPHLAAWCDTVPGVGIPTVAKLIGVIGSPCIAYPFIWETDDDGKRAKKPTPLPPYWRSLSQLRSYCGYGDPTRRRQRGMSAEDALGLGNPRAKTLLYLIVEACVKVNRGPIREAYDEGRARYKAAEEAKEITPGHAQARAYRLAAKEVLKGLWTADRIHHGLPVGIEPSL